MKKKLQKNVKVKNNNKKIVNCFPTDYTRQRPKNFKNQTYFFG